MWQSTGSANIKWNVSCYSPRVQALLFGFFVDLFAGGGARQRQQWHLIPLPTRAGRWQTVWQGPRLGFLVETGRCVAMETTWVRFSCFCALLPTFLFYFLYFLVFSCIPPSMFIFFVFLRLCSSHLLSSSTYFIVRVLSACVICTLPHLGILLSLFVWYFFRSSYFSGVVFLLCSRTWYASTWVSYLDSSATFGFALSHCDHRICTSLGWIRKDTGVTADCRWVEKTV